MRIHGCLLISLEGCRHSSATQRARSSGQAYLEIEAVRRACVMMRMRQRLRGSRLTQKPEVLTVNVQRAAQLICPRSPSTWWSIRTAEEEEGYTSVEELLALAADRKRCAASMQPMQPEWDRSTQRTTTRRSQWWQAHWMQEEWRKGAEIHDLKFTGWTTI